MPKQTSFYDLDNRYASLRQAGDPLEHLNPVIDWALFRPLLAKIDEKKRKSTAGRKPLDRMLMFKLLIVQRLHNVADERLQFLVTDRLSFMRFLRLDLAANVPDARTVWTFREALRRHELVAPLFDRFHEALRSLGVELKSGQIVDTTFVPVPIQRNSREENAQIKVGEVPKTFDETPNKIPHKDVEGAGRRRTARTTTATRITSTSTTPPSGSRQASPARQRTRQQGAR